MTKSVTKVQDKDTNKRLSVVRSTADPTKYGVVILNPDGSKISGPKGDKGDPGEAGKVAVGTTTTGQPGTSASVTNTGTPSCAVLNFTIPRGDKGASGQDGNGISCVTCEKVGKVTTVTICETDGDSTSFSVCDGLDGEGSGDVLGPSVSVDEDIVVFDGTSGKLIKDSGKKVSCFADVSSNQTIGGTKTFTTSPVVPNKTSDVSNDGTAIATEAQVKAVKDAIPSVVDSLCCSSTTSALSANQGKELKSLIDKYTGLGRFLSLWNATTGQPMTFPLDIPYTYKTGDWFMVEVVGSTNYKPDGSSYTGSASTVVDSVNNVEVRDVYIYDGTDWLFQKNNETQVSFSDIAGVPSDNACLCSALNSKANDDAVVKLSGNQTVNGVKTFGSEIVLPNKTADATNCGTKPATEAQVYSVKQSIPTDNCQLGNGCGYTTCLGTITSSDVATDSCYGLVKLGSSCVQSVNAGTPSGCMGRSYAVQNDSTGNMVVNVPWVESIVKSSTEPASPSEGDVWYDTANDVLKVYDGSSWKEVGSGAMIEYTQQEYDALPDTKLTDGVWRLIYE